MADGRREVHALSTPCGRSVASVMPTDDDVTLLVPRTASVLIARSPWSFPATRRAWDDARAPAPVARRDRRPRARDRRDHDGDERGCAERHRARARFGEKPLRVEFARVDGSITVTVRDEGRWRQGRSTDRGRGFPLMRALMESVEVQRSPEGSAVVLRRKLRK